jgi:hypothetical protein
MKFLIKTVFLTAAAFSLSMGLISCGPPPEPTVFGVPEHVWVTLSPQERQQVINGYNTEQKINAQNAPIEGVISATAGAINNQQNLNAAQNNNGFPPIPMPQIPQL